MNTTIRDENEKINTEELIIAGAPLKQLCTFRTGGEADYLARPKNLEELRVLLRWAKERSLPVTILGGGSNVLISDRGVEGLVISTVTLSSTHVRGLLSVSQCGISLDRLINYTIEHNLSGLEPFGGIPGTIGGAVRGNAGLIDYSISEVLEWVDYLDPNGNLFRYYPQTQINEYRRSFFSDTPFILYEIALRLTSHRNTSEARQRKEASRRDRLQQGQYDLPCAGCMFKNPEGASAGKLIDNLHLKNTRLGGAMVSNSHANYIVNVARDTKSEDIFALSEQVREQVSRAYGIDLEREVVLIGRW
ncbi:MAG: UDP-N-acetylmuramate dehydrogenase [Sphaerochaetaceae bacterium]|nr:UDP-N-acetylmuramate dehydrogenase [Sphaerochaetaceae bacterium]